MITKLKESQVTKDNKGVFLDGQRILLVDGVFLTGKEILVSLNYCGNNLDLVEYRSINDNIYITYSGKTEKNTIIVLELMVATFGDSVLHVGEHRFLRGPSFATNLPKIVKYGFTFIGPSSPELSMDENKRFSLHSTTKIGDDVLRLESVETDHNGKREAHFSIYSEKDKKSVVVRF